MKTEHLTISAALLISLAMCDNSTSCPIFWCIGKGPQIYAPKC